MRIVAPIPEQIFLYLIFLGGKKFLFEGFQKHLFFWGATFYFFFLLYGSQNIFFGMGPETVFLGGEGDMNGYKFLNLRN